MVKILREADMVPVADVAKKCGVSEQISNVWLSFSLDSSFDDLLRVSLGKV